MSDITDFFGKDEVLEFLSEGLVFTDMDGKIVAINVAGAKALGFGSPAELVGTNIRDRSTLPETIDRFTQIIKKTGGIDDYMIFALKRDGRYAHLEAQSRLHRDDKGAAIGIATMFRDVSEKEFYKRALEKAEDRYQRLFNSISEGYIRFAPDYTVVFINPHGAKMLGFDSPMDLVGKSIVDMWVNPEDQQALRKQLIEQGRLIKVLARMNTADGRVATFEISERIITGRYGEIIGADALFRDVTDEILLKTEREQSLELYRHVLQNCSEFVFTVDRDANIRFVNNAFTRVLGYAREDIGGINLFDLVPPEDHHIVTPVRLRVRNGETVAGITVRLAAKDGCLIPLEWTTMPIIPPLFDGTSAVLIATNISELVELQKRVDGVDEDKEQNG